MADIIPKPGTVWEAGQAPVSLIWPGTREWNRAMLKPMGAATSVAVGLRGACTAPAAGDQLRAWTGGATFANQLEIASIVTAAGSKICDFNSLGDGDNRLSITAADATGETTRVTARSQAGNANVGIRLEPTGVSRVSEWDDPFLTTIRPMRHVIADAYVASFSRHGLGAPVSTSFDPTAASTPQAPDVLDDTPADASGNITSETVGCFLRHSTGTTSGNVCGVAMGPLCRRQSFPELYFWGRSAFLHSRFILGVCDTDPSLDLTSGSSLVTTNNFGLAIWYDDSIHADAIMRFAVFNKVVSTTVDCDVRVVSGVTVLHRKDGNSFITDGFKEGHLLTLSSMHNPANNIQIRVAKIASGANITPVGTPLTIDATSATATIAGGGQQQISTGLALPTANQRFAFRARYIDNYVWQLSGYNFATKVWGSHLYTNGTYTPGNVDLLNGFWRLRTNEGSNHSTAPGGWAWRAAA